MDRNVDDGAQAEVARTTFRVRLGYADMEAFLGGYAGHVAEDEVYVPTKRPKPEGTELRFELSLGDGTVVLRGFGRVAWTAPFDAAHPSVRFGMGLRSLTLDDASRDVFRRLIERKARPPAPPGGAPGGERARPSEQPAPRRISLVEADHLLESLGGGAPQRRSDAPPAPPAAEAPPPAARSTEPMALPAKPRPALPPMDPIHVVMEPPPERFPGARRSMALTPPIVPLDAETALLAGFQEDPKPLGGRPTPVPVEPIAVVGVDARSGAPDSTQRGSLVEAAMAMRRALERVAVARKRESEPPTPLSILMAGPSSEEMREPDAEPVFRPPPERVAEVADEFGTVRRAAPPVPESGRPGPGDSATPVPAPPAPTLPQLVRPTRPRRPGSVPLFTDEPSEIRTLQAAGESIPASSPPERAATDAAKLPALDDVVSAPASMPPRAPQPELEPAIWEADDVSEPGPAGDEVPVAAPEPIALGDDEDGVNLDAILRDVMEARVAASELPGTPMPAGEVAEEPGAAAATGRADAPAEADSTEVIAQPSPLESAGDAAGFDMAAYLKSLDGRGDDIGEFAGDEDESEPSMPAGPPEAAPPPRHPGPPIAAAQAPPADADSDALPANAIIPRPPTVKKPGLLGKLLGKHRK